MRRHWIARALAITLAALVAGTGAPPPALAQATRYEAITGGGSTWAQVAIDVMRTSVKSFGLTVNYAGTGSTTGRTDFINNQVDFAASDIPFQFQPEDGSRPEQPKSGYAYIPVVAGGTSFMYNLKINGKRVTNLRMSGENVSKVFTGAITQWDDPAIKADNPGLALPNRKVVPVVRSDGSGSTAQFTRWMIHRYEGIWNDYCQRSRRAPACGFTSQYPLIEGMINKKGDDGVAAYLVEALAEGAIGYVNYSYALNSGFPVVKVLNAAGYYTEPTPENVAVSLLKADINRDAGSPDYLTQKLDGVYTDPDPRNYQLSSYSYFILRTETTSQFTAAKGRSLGFFAYYAMCQAQQDSASNGYSPMPINLVEASFEQIRKIPGVEVQNVKISDCKNPTFSSDGTNLLAKNAAMPPDCDKQGPTQCTTGTAGARTATAVSGGGGGGGASGGGGGAPGGGGAAGGGGASSGAGAGRQAGGAAGGSGTAGSAGGAACDPDTGACAEVANAGEGVADDFSGGSEQASASPSVLSASAGWSTHTTLIAFVLLLVLALLFAPAVAWRHLSSGGKHQ